MMRKREQAAESTGAALALRPARAAPLACASAVKSVASPIAVARPALTSQGMPKSK